MDDNKTGIVLMNLGSPDSTSIPDVKKYLDEFLMDKNVMDYPWLFRALLVKGLIIPARAPKSAEAYQSIWTANGSPLIELTRQLKNELSTRIKFPITIAMRYGNPSPKEAFDILLQQRPGLERVLVIPLYPHYAMSSYKTAVAHAEKIHADHKYNFKLDFIKPFYNDVNYLDALAASMQTFLQQEYDHILFSYHGLPERHLKKDDITGRHCLQVENCCNVLSPAHQFCYRHQVLKTTEEIVNRLGIPVDKYSNSFQSRLGKGWLQPFTDKELEAFPARGIKKLLVVCPAFVSDCLETIEEIAEEGKHIFMQAGGVSYTMIPCMNMHPAWVSTISGWINDYSNGSSLMLLKK